VEGRNQLKPKKIPIRKIVVTPRPKIKKIIADSAVSQRFPVAARIDRTNQKDRLL
jgi:hypothetical protein